MADPPEYEEYTRDRYKSEDKAEKYHGLISGTRDLRAARGRLVTAGERRIISKYLKRVPNNRILDIPAGTGKLAPVFADIGSEITSCDISEEMLRVCKQTYDKLGYSNVEYRICDAESIQDTVEGEFDVAVCLRLLHRVPEEVQLNILRQLSNIADYSIVSFGCKRRYGQNIRNTINSIAGADTDKPYLIKFDNCVKRIRNDFIILNYSWTVPLISTQPIFLLQPKETS